MDVRNVVRINHDPIEWRSKLEEPNGLLLFLFLLALSRMRGHRFKIIAKKRSNGNMRKNVFAQ